MQPLAILSPEGLPARLEGQPDSSTDVLVILPVTDRWQVLFEEERGALPSRHEGRRQSYASARACAHIAFTELGLQKVPVRRSDSGAPVWPDGVRGSLTHSEALAASCLTVSCRSVGIDIEHTGRMSAGVARRVLTDEELAGVDPDSPAGLDEATLLFSAKEAVYKAIFPIAGLYIGYQEVTLNVDPSTQRFSARYLGSDASNARLSHGEGEYWRIGHAVLCKFAVALP